MKIAIAMPAFCEADGIGQFHADLSASLSDLNCKFFLIDDCSTDGTAEISGRLGFHVSSNDRNLGHGPSYLNALEIAHESGAEFILLTDGDGQISGQDVRRLILEGVSRGLDLTLGVRVNRHEPAYRRVTSNILRILVWFRSGVWSSDVNSPHRLLSRRGAKAYLELIDRAALIPNVHGTVLFNRSLELSSAEIPVEFRVRRGADANGVTWGPIVSLLPSRKFVKFVLSAFREFLRSRKIY